MSQLMRQALNNEVTSLSDIVLRLHQHAEQLTAFLQLDPKDVPIREEAEIARNLKVGYLQLQHNIDSFSANLRDYRDYIKSLTDPEEKKEEEAKIAAFPLPNDELYTETELQSGQWPIFRLHLKAKQVLGRIQAYLMERAESSNSIASRTPTPAPSLHEKDNNRKARHNDKALEASDEDDFFDAAHHNATLKGPILNVPLLPRTTTRNLQNNREFGIGNATSLFGGGFHLQQQQHQHKAANGGAAAFITSTSHNSRQNSPPPPPRGPPPTAPPLHSTSNNPPPPPSRHVHRQHRQRSPSPLHDDALRVNRIEIPKFSGSSEDWVTFWAAFDFAVHSRNYRNFQKFLLLLQYLEKGSAAHMLVKAYPPTDDNYPTVIAILQRKFGNERVRRDQLHAQLLHLHTAKNNLKDLQHLQQDIERICTQLNNMNTGMVGAPRVHNSLVVDIIKSKLPQPVLLELIKMERDASFPWTDEDWRDGLASIVDAREQADICVRTFQQEPEVASKNNAQQHGQHSAPKGNVRPHRQTSHQPHREHQAIENTRAFPVVEQFGQRGDQPQQLHFSCSMCSKEGHRPSNCTTFNTIAQRKKRLEEQGRCLRCLRQDHNTTDCSRRDICHGCNSRDHHYVLCPAREAPPPTTRSTAPQQRFNKPAWKPPAKVTGSNAQPLNKTAPTSSQRTFATLLEELGEATHLDSFAAEESSVLADTTLATWSESSNTDGEIITTSPKKTAAHLMTQTLKVSCHGGPKDGISAFVFYDPGSQSSFINRAFVEKLHPPQLGEQWLRILTFGSRDPHVTRSATVAVRLQRQDGGWEQLKLSVVDEITTEMTALQWDKLIPMPKSLTTRQL